MKHDNTPTFAIFTDDEGLYLRLSRALALWGEAMCLRFRTLHANASGAQCAPADLVILDMNAGDEVLPAQLPGGCFVLAVARGEEQCMRACRWHARARLKPDFDWDSLCLALGQCFDAWCAGLVSLRLSKQLTLPLCQLQYAEALGRRAILHGALETLIVPIPFGKLAAQLPSPPFLRCQRSYIVNLCAVERLRSGQFELRDGTRIPVSRAGAEAVRQQFLQWRQRGRMLL